MTLPAEGLRVKLTYYWISLRPSGDPDEVDIKECKTGKVLTRASRAWRDKALIEGTARFRDSAGVSRTVNIGSGGKCWNLLDYDSRWGLGVTDPSTKKSFLLRPFKSIAVDPAVMTIGRWYYVKELAGMQMPYPVSTMKHDGLVRAVDVGPDIKGPHIDFFCAYEKSYQTLSRLHGSALDHVTILEVP